MTRQAVTKHLAVLEEAELVTAVRRGEWAKAGDVPEETLKAYAAEPRTQVTFDIEPTASAVKLTVTHGGFSNDWPVIVSSLKTLLESGQPL
jgi:DNA-binding transcriptional ArsR family regulator